MVTLISVKAEPPNGNEPRGGETVADFSLTAILSAVNSIYPLLDELILMQLFELSIVKRLFV